MSLNYNCAGNYNNDVRTTAKYLRAWVNYLVYTEKCLLENKEFGLNIKISVMKTGQVFMS